MDLGIHGRTAIVTGASEGIGRATAVQLAREGVSVIGVARSGPKLADLVAEIESGGGRAHGVTADLSSAAGVDEAVGRVEQIGLPVDILVNNVGGGLTQPQDLFDITDEVWNGIYELNLMSAVRLSRALAPGMVGRQWGRLVHVASIGARETGPGVPHYSSAKAALLAFSKSLSQAYGRSNVLSNCVIPGVTYTRAIEQQAIELSEAKGISKEDARVKLANFRPASVGRMGEASEVAAAIAFLSSQAASYITGASLVVDGGTLLGVW